MRIIVTLEKRFDRTANGHVWSKGWLEYSFWQRYLDVFEEVRVVARLRDVDEAPSGTQRADGPGVSFVSVPYFVGPWQFAQRYVATHRAARAALSEPDAVILRVPGTIGGMLERPLRAANRPYGVEVVGDPYDVFAPGAVRSVMRPFLRWWVPRALRRQCAGACAAAYVTAAALQRRYPPATGACVTSYSSVDLRDDAFVAKPRTFDSSEPPWRVVLVGSLAQLYKGPEVLIEAVARCVGHGLDLQLTIVGDGKCRPQLESLVRARDLSKRVRFVGTLRAGEAVRAELDRADLFVLPSRSEGLPRALIEAMARGLPCVATRVGGIPELLSAEELVAPGDAQALSELMEKVLTDRDRMTRLSARNLEKAAEYGVRTLRARRRAFYGALRDATMRWREGRSIDAQ